ncbi:MAG TPA: D-alanyl-D-alanine carboxypeptidase family protein [Ilumatobacteraceae bacterium]
MSARGEVDDWIELPDPEEVEDQPIGSDDDLDHEGYDAADDPASAPPRAAPPAGPPPTRGPQAPFPIAPAAIPAWVKGMKNGELPAESMVKVAPLSGTKGSLVPEAAAAWRNLQNAAAAAGFTLTMTNGYRNLTEQEWLFTSRFQEQNTGGKAKQWKGKTFFLKPKVANAAVPGTSNHGWGCAVDMALDGYGADAKPVAGNSSFMAWVRANAGPLGWSWEVQSEAWHLRLVSFTNATQSATQSTGQTTPLQAPTPTLKETSKGGQVAALQTLCAFYRWGDVGRADGTFGPKTKAGVIAMQTALGTKPDGEYGPKSAAALGSFLATAATG